MAVLLGFHLYDMIVSESMILFLTIEHPEFPEVIIDARLIMGFSNTMTVNVCVGLLFISIGLYLVEFYICKYIDNIREVENN